MEQATFSYKYEISSVWDVVPDERNVNNETVNNVTLSNDTGDTSRELIDLNCTVTKTFQIVSLTVTILIIAGTFFGNALILVSLNKFRKQFRGSLYVLIANLAVADIFLALGLTLHFVEYILPSFKLDTNPLFCLVKMGFTVVSLMNSTITLMFMALDRFCAIAYPMHHFLRHRHSRRMCCIILGIWIVSLICGFLPTIASVKRVRLYGVACRYGLCVPRELTLVAVGMLVFENLFNIVLCCLIIWKVKKTIQSATKSKQKSMKSKSALLVKVYILFAISWLPFMVLTLLLETKTSVEVRQNLQCFREYMLYVGMLNSTMNWIIYGLANSRFRKAFMNVLCCKEFQENRSSA